MTSHPASVTTPQAALLVVLSAGIWGYGFVATADALQASGPLWLSALRFFLATTLALPYLLYVRRRRPAAVSFAQLRLAAIPALLIGSTLILQTYGLGLTTVTNSGFITTLYVLIVPLLERLLLRRPVGAAHFAWVALALVGTLLMTGAHVGALRIGDLLTLAAAFGAALHLLWVDHIITRVVEPFSFNTFQSLWCGLLTLPFALSLETFPSAPWPARSLFGLAWVTFGSTTVAFALQFVAQRRLSPRVASLLFLLESPLAALFAWYFHGESLTAVQAAGGALILFAACGAIVAKGAVGECGERGGRRRHRTRKKEKGKT